MSANLGVKADGSAAMFYVKREGVPWHGAGYAVEEAQSSADAIIAAGQNWRVGKYPAVTVWTDSEGVPHKHVSDKTFLLMREDTGFELASAGVNYTPFQNEEAFAFFDALVGERLAVYHTAGVLGNGEKVWILAKLPGELRIKGTDDVTEKYILLAQSHVPGTALKIVLTAVRVVCQNTFNIALSGAARAETFTVWHTQRIYDRIEEARQILGIAEAQYTSMDFILNEFANREVTQEEVDEVVAKILPLPEGEEVNPNYVLNQRELVKGLYETGPGNEAKKVRGTAYPLYHAFTDYVDHYRPTRVRGDSTESDAVLSSVWFGSGGGIKAKALRTVSDLVDIDVDLALATSI